MTPSPDLMRNINLMLVEKYKLYWFLGCKSLKFFAKKQAYQYNFEQVNYMIMCWQYTTHSSQ